MTTLTTKGNLKVVAVKSIDDSIELLNLRAELKDKDKLLLALETKLRKIRDDITRMIGG